MIAPHPNAMWVAHVGLHETYQVVGRRGGLFHSRRGSWYHITSFCIDDPEQGPVVVLPIVSPVQRKGLGIGDG